ncbi:MAG: deaminase [Lautropia sp.]
MYDPGFMRQALRLAADASATPGTRPFGAVVVRDGRVVGSGLNHVLANADPTSHGEIEAIRDACRALGTVDLSGCELYTSCEPCPLCVAAMRIAGIRTVWYGASLAQSDAVLGTLPDGERRAIDVDDLRAQAGVPLAEGAIASSQRMSQEAVAVLEAWAAPRRSSPAVRVAIERLVAARRDGVAAQVPDAPALATPAEAYAVQAGVASALHWFDGVPAFWKSGGGSRTAVQTHAPLPPAGVLASPADLSGRRFAHGHVEIEIALRLGRDVDAATAATLDPTAAARLVDAMCVAIEIVDTRWRDGLDAPPLAKLADLQAHGALVLGGWVPWRAVDWARQRCEARIGDAPLREYVGAHSMGDPAWVLPRWLRHASSDGSIVPDGTVVTTGSWCGMLPVATGQAVVARFDDIGDARGQL